MCSTVEPSCNSYTVTASPIGVPVIVAASLLTVKTSLLAMLAFSEIISLPNLVFNNSSVKTSASKFNVPSGTPSKAILLTPLAKAYICS